MIDREDILNYAKINSLDPFWVENDYLQHIVLTNLFSEIASELVLKGGTALQKVYGLDRLSKDLDFNLSDERLVKRFEAGLDRINGYCTTSVEVPKKVKHGLGYTVILQGPSSAALGEPHRMRITINLEERLAIVPVFKSINPSTIYKDPDLHTYSLLAMDKEEILAEKVRALITRKNVEPRDLYDLRFLIESNTKINRPLIDDKLSFDHSEFSMKAFRKRVGEIRKLWEKDLGGIIRDLPDYGETARIVLSKIDSK